MSQTWWMLKRLIHQRRQCLFYAYDANQGAGTPDEHVEVYESWAAIPVDWRKSIVPSRWLDPKYFRLCRGADGDDAGGRRAGDPGGDPDHLARAAAWSAAR